MDLTKPSPFGDHSPVLDKENPFESMMQRFDVAAHLLNLDAGLYEYLKTPVRQVIVSLPIAMDNGDVRVFEGYRVIHNDILEIRSRTRHFWRGYSTSVDQVTRANQNRL